MKLENFPIESLSKENLIEIIKGYDNALTNNTNKEVEALKKRNKELETDNEDLKGRVEFFKDECSRFIRKSKTLCQDIKALQKKYYEDINGYFMNELRQLRFNYGYGHPESYDTDDDSDCEE
ncbi:MAG: hypothetical protein GY739_04075 [Mesoflavibacter sp.]|nr:hypothetical protein [Mesoflavibacter sp.]